MRCPLLSLRFWIAMLLMGTATELTTAWVSSCLSMSWVASASASTFYVDGDPIGSDSITTDNTGGFTAVLQDSDNLGQPAIQVLLTGQELLAELRVVVFGLPGSNGDLFFQEFNYGLDLWRSSNYFSGATPEFHIELGQPANINLVSSNTGPSIIPDTPFGSAGIVGVNSDTYDFRFDLTDLPATETTQDAFKSPFAAGDWVLGFQSSHNTEASGVLRVVASNAPQGPLPLFSRGDSFPRGILGGQDPSNIGLRWGISLTASDFLPGDFDLDLDVDSQDVAIWSESFGIDNSADADFDGDSDGADFLAWQRNFGAGFIASELAVPEPSGVVLVVAAVFCLTGIQTRVINTRKQRAEREPNFEMERMSTKRNITRGVCE